MTSNRSEPAKLDLDIRRDIRTSNPRKFLRFLRNTCRGMGYQIGTDSIDVMEDEVGEVGVVRGKLVVKDPHVEVQTVRRYDLPEYAAPALVVTGIMFWILGLFGLGGVLGMVPGTILLIAGIYLHIFNEQQQRTVWANRIEVEVEGEVYEGEQQTDQPSGSQTRETRVTAELTVMLTGYTLYPKAEGTDLAADIRTLADQIEGFVAV